MSVRNNVSLVWRLALGALILVFVLGALLTPARQPAAAQTCSTYYKVQSGDTLSAIAVKYGTTAEAIAAANNMKVTDPIFVGQSLCIPAGASVQATGTPSAGTPTSSTRGFTVTPQGLYLVTIKANKMAPNTPYYVNLYNYNRRLPLTRIGRLKTDKSGNGTQVFGIPISFISPDAVKQGKWATICMKNPWNDAATCQSFKLKQ